LKILNSVVAMVGRVIGDQLASSRRRQECRTSRDDYETSFCKQVNSYC
jgi:hypothetical protein